MLDVGTGSGVLAITAILLGAASVEAIDIDPIAAEVARQNCDANGIGTEVRVSAGVLADDHPGRYDLVLSNISTDANLRLAPIFGKVVKPGGFAILSGILSPDARRAQAAMAHHGFALTAIRHERDWCQLQFRRS